MPRRELLSSAQREELLSFPTEEVDLIRYYTLALMISRSSAGVVAFKTGLGSLCSCVIYVFPVG
jgi:hypothetical protein